MANTPQQNTQSSYTGSFKTSEHPTIDATMEAYDRKKNETADQETLAKQSQFRSQIDSYEKAGYTTQDSDEPHQLYNKNVPPIQDTFRRQAGVPTSPQQGNDDSKGLSMTWFFVALLFSLTIDAASAIINVIAPAIGGVVSSAILTPTGLGILWYIHKIDGVEFSKNIRTRFIGTTIIELIPVINTLPALTALVILNKISPVIKDLVDKTPIGDMVPKK